MLSPEVWNFKAPDSEFRTEVTDDIASVKKINQFHFSHVISVFLPDSLKVPEAVTDKLNVDCEYYYIQNFNISDLIDVDFLTCFIRSGKLSFLSSNNRIDCDTCVAVTPTGQLFLKCDKETYQTLGLVGKLSHYCSKDKSRYIINIDLNSDSLKPGKSSYERTKQCLRNIPEISVIFSWEPPLEELCPSSIAQYFADKSYKVKLCQPKYTPNTVYSVKVPVIDFNQTQNTDFAEFSEWLGMISLDADLENSESYVSTYETPEPNIQLGQIKCLQWKGFFTSAQVQSLLEALQQTYMLEDKPWVALYVQGFSDSAVAWGHREHHYYTNGDNGYVLIFKNNKFVVCSQECSKKVYK